MSEIETTLVTIENRLAEVVSNQLAAEFAEEWDVNGLLIELQNTYPTRLDAEAIHQYEDREDIVALVVDDALTQYETKCENYPGGLEMAKEIERDVMLQIVDQRWREHLSDMDYLREGIHLRQVAQQDPLTAWQREGYGMFETLLESINADFVRYITHVEAVPDEPEVDPDEVMEHAVTNADIVAPGSAGLPAHAGPVKPTAKEGDKIGRNEPCWCGSGRKFKQCHGRP